MNSRVRHVDHAARKALGDTPISEARRMVRNSELLASTGLRTPDTYLDSASHELVMPWIDGISSLERLSHDRLNSGYCHWGDIPASELSHLVMPLLSIHAADSARMDLDRFDPWRRIRPRIRRLACSSKRGLPGEIAGVLRMLRRTEAILAKSQPSAYVPVHGDYHVGQLLFDQLHTTPWLLDLEDVARGHRESDLGNFAAHCATTPALQYLGVLDDFMMLSDMLRDVYANLSGIRPDATRINYYGMVALLRRALKLTELQRRQPATSEILHAIRVLSTRNRNRTDCAGHWQEKNFA